jgi:hypothetical protein
MHRLALIVSLVVVAVPLFVFVVRPWYVTWGASKAEVARTLPGDELVPQPRLPSTRAIIIKAPAGKVWPWLVQLGYGRAGWYNHDWINCGLFGARYYEGRHSSNRILPQFQTLKVGDTIPLAPGMGWEVVALEPNRLMVLTAQVDLQTGKTFQPGAPRPQKYLHSSEVYLLEELDDRTTRFTVRDHLDFQMGWMNLLAYALEPGYFIQESAFMQGVKRRAEALAGRSQE